jgi:peptide/nickel transport system substrate-binding protein
MILRIEDSFPGAPDASALFQQSLSQAGIPLEIKREPNDGYWSEVWNAQPFCTSYWGGRPTQDQMFTTAYLSTADWNDTRFQNPQFDQLLIAARAELDQAKRTQMYADMGAMVRDEGGLVCPMFNDFVDAISDRVAGYEEGGVGYELMNFYAPIQMWVAA